MRAAVRVAQMRLQRETPALAVDGIWGPKTDAAYDGAPAVVKNDVAEAVSKYGVSVEDLRKRRFSATNDYVEVRDRAIAAGLKGDDLLYFLATVQAESNFRFNAVELGGYSSLSAARTAFAKNKAINKLNDAELLALLGQGPTALLSVAYGGRNGNDGPGYGWKYRGRGLIQLTWKDNYAIIGRAIGLGNKLVDDPDLVIKDRDIGMKVALAYWRARVKPGSDITAVTRAIMGSATDANVNKRAAFANKLKSDPALV